MAGNTRKPSFVTALVATEEGDIIDLPGYAAVGASAGYLTPLTPADTVPMPHGSELMFLPDRFPVVYDLESQSMAMLYQDPYEPGQRLFPVAVFNSPGYATLHTAAWEEDDPDIDPLPMFSYGACGWHGGGVASAAVRVDRSRRQDLRLMPENKILAGVERVRQSLPENRLARHIENCALEYGCPAAKNFFIGRQEAPLPTSPSCNAKCLGCLSKQNPDSSIHVSQERIAFTPEPDEIAGVALEHFKRVPDGVVSFGQGCEGDPLLVSEPICEAIRIIRKKTGRGTININTNAGRPDLLEKVLEAGADSVRVSTNSFRPACHQAYFRPSFSLDDVLESMALTVQNKRWLSVNYLFMAGFTDTPGEYEALRRVFSKTPASMIQWRNLNFDPPRYHQAMALADEQEEPMGVQTLLDKIRGCFPDLRFGYFNPKVG